MLGEASVVCNVQQWSKFRMEFAGVRQSSYGMCKSVRVFVLDVQVAESEQTRMKCVGMFGKAYKRSLKDLNKEREG